MSGGEIWNDVQEEVWTAWRGVFNADPISPHLRDQCPVCGHAALYRWYQLDQPGPRVVKGIEFDGPGQLWEWCARCHASEYFRDALVPTGWRPWLVVEVSLGFDPDVLEKLRQAAASGGPSGEIS